jgi:dephospho-CoA kinase
MFVVGVAGGIGSGKTTVTDRFAELGVTIADADVASRTIVEPGKPAHAEIVARYGTDILLKDCNLNRPKLREIVFSDPNERKWLEQLTHGPINAELKQTMEQATSSYAILVLSAGSGNSPVMNRVLVVDVPPAIQLQRVTNRDNSSPEQIQAIMDAQPSRDVRLKLADDLILNDGGLEQLINCVDTLHNKYIELADIEENTG